MKEPQSIKEYDAVQTGDCVNLDSHCPYAVPMDDDGESTAGECYYHCQLLNKAVWGDRPECPESLWENDEGRLDSQIEVLNQQIIALYQVATQHNLTLKNAPLLGDATHEGLIEKLNESSDIGLSIETVIVSAASPDWEPETETAKFIWMTKYRESIAFDTQGEALLDFLKTINWQSPYLWQATESEEAPF